MGGRCRNLCSDFKCLTDKEMEELDFMMVSDESSRQYIFKFDLGSYYFCYLLFMYISQSIMFLSYEFQSICVNS